jgi:RHS repeat-associated protein
MNVISGNVSHEQSLFSAQGGALPLEIGLSYNSLDRLGGVLGVGWSHSYDIYLHQNSDGTMVLTGGVGKRFYFVDGSGYKARTGDFSTLVHNGDDTWTVTLRSGLKYQFGADKKLTAIVDRYGNAVTVDSTVAGQTTVTDPAGRIAVIHYTGGKITSITDPGQKQYDFTYDTNGMLWKAQYPEPVAGSGRPLWECKYTATDSYLEYLKDPEGHITKYGYTGGKVSRMVDPEGVIDMNGGESADVAQHTKTLQYDYPSVGLTTLTEKDGGVWVYAYDKTEGVLTGKVGPAGSVSTSTYYPAGHTFAGLTETRSEPVREEASGANTVRTLYVTTTLGYDANGNPLEVTGHVRHLTIDAQGNLIGTANDPADSHLVYTYGSYDRVTSVTDQIAGTTTSIAYNTTFDASGTIDSETVTLTAPKINAADPGGPQTVILYDTRGLVDLVTDPLGRQTDFGYTAAGLPQTVNDVTGGIVATFSVFDPFGRPKTVTVSKAGQPDRVTTLDYDDLGRPKSVTQPNVVLAEGGSPVSLLTQFGYDQLGNRTAVTDAENRTTGFDYNYRGQVTRITDALNQVTELLYSGAGCASCGAGVDKLVGVKDANLHQTDFTYYDTGELKSEIAPGDLATRRLLYTYHPGGHLKEKRRDADGDGEVGSGDQVILSFTYNPDGKLAGKTDHLTGETTTFSYYPLGQAHAGLLQSAASPAVTYAFDYFDNGWLKSVTDTTNNRTIRYDAYDALGRRELVTLLPGTADEKVLDYVYDGQKRLEQIVSAAGTFSFGYDDWQRRGSLTYPNGVVASYGYNGQTDWLTGITYKEGAAGPVLLDIAYPEHDKVGNRKQRTEDNVATTYAYDDVYQLRQARTGASEENFNYDAVGNRKSGPTVKDTEAAAYDHDDANRMLEGRKFDYAYDDFGNQQYRYLDAAHTKFWQYTWDGENRMTKAELKKDGQVLRTVTFKYDPFGRRIEKKVVEGTTTTTYGFVYDAEDIVQENKTVQVGGGSPVTTSTHYVHGPGVDEPLAMIRNGQAYFYHVDGLGSIVAITDDAQNVVQRYGYESFGMRTSSTAFENAYTYTGREWDKEIGLYYYRARYYDPMEGRFVSRDPIGFAGGDVNLYRYVQNNPVIAIDPFGLMDLQKLADCLIRNVSPKPTGKCATSVRECMEEAGADMKIRPEYAKNYGEKLKGLGFEPISTSDYKLGDIAVIQPTKGRTEGHIQVFDGNNWMADFKNRDGDFWPGPNYRNEKPNYKIYRQR